MKILIIDDEAKARNLLRQIILDYFGEMHGIFEAADLMEGVALIKNERPALVFLDIEMPRHSGITILDHFEPGSIDFEIVFTTAYSEYALKAFELNAIDYLLKPIRPKRIKEVILRVENQLDKEDFNQRFEELKTSLATQKFSKIGLPVTDGILFVPIEDLIHLEADGMYTRVHTRGNGTQVVSKPLKFFEQHLTDQEAFFRSHRSHIFNLHALKKLVKKDGNFLLLENDHLVPISRDRKEDILNLIQSL